MSRLSLSLLGPPRVEKDGVPVKLETRKVIALLAYLVVKGGSHSRDALIDLLWPDADAEHARGDLRHALSDLRSALGGSGCWLSMTRSP